tara:strand:+ start:2497 stop:3165 length:669 start_codon:yes stop_codon:yes gene_type:complete
MLAVSTVQAQSPEETDYWSAYSDWELAAEAVAIAEIDRESCLAAGALLASALEATPGLQSELAQASEVRNARYAAIASWLSAEAVAFEDQYNEAGDFMFWDDAKITAYESAVSDTAIARYRHEQSVIIWQSAWDAFVANLNTIFDQQQLIDALHIYGHDVDALQLIADALAQIMDDAEDAWIESQGGAVLNANRVDETGQFWQPTPHEMDARHIPAVARCRR